MEEIDDGHTAEERAISDAAMVLVEEACVAFDGNRMPPLPLTLEGLGSLEAAVSKTADKISQGHSEQKVRTLERYDRGMQLLVRARNVLTHGSEAKAEAFMKAERIAAAAAANTVEPEPEAAPAVEEVVEVVEANVKTTVEVTLDAYSL